MEKEEIRFDVPVVMIVYKRYDLTERSFEQIRKLKPEKLYIISDGPKNEEDAVAVNKVRDYIDSNIDWDCEVHRNYAEKNMGLRYRMPSGMAWVFESEDRAIFIEDDIEAVQSFFWFCRDMLEHYKDDERIAMISGTNLHPGVKCFGDGDICFSAFASIWGWATWKRAWQLYDVNIRRWPELKKKKYFKKVLDKNTYNFFSIVFDDLQYHWYRTWGYQWSFMMWANDKLGIIPKYDLIHNTGMGDERGEHPGDSADKISYVAEVERGEMELPIKYPDKVERNKEYDDLFQKSFFTEKIGIFKRMKYRLRSAIYERVYDTIKEMEKDDEYFNNVLEEKYKLNEEELKMNPTDRYRLINPGEMRKSAREYRKYKKAAK